MKPRLLSQRGITLLEIISTAVIVSIVAAMAVPRFQVAFERTKFRGVNRDIVSSLRLARSMAITDKSQYGVYFDGYDGVITVFKDSISPAGYTFDAGDPVIRSDTLPPEVSYMHTDVVNDVITFSANGSAAFNGGGNVGTHGYLSNGSMTEYFHNILRSTGRVRSYTDWEEWAESHDPYYEDQG